MYSLKLIQCMYIASVSSGSPERKLSFSAGGDNNNELVRQLNDYKSTIKQLKSALEDSYAAVNIETKISSSADQVDISK